MNSAVDAPARAPAAEPPRDPYWTEDEFADQAILTIAGALLSVDPKGAADQPDRFGNLVATLAGRLVGVRRGVQDFLRTEASFDDFLRTDARRNRSVKRDTE